MSPRAGKASPVRAVVRADSVVFYCFLFGLVLLVFGGCPPQNLAAAKGEQVELWSSPVNAGLCCLCIDSSNAGGLHLFVCFPRPPPHCDFLVEKSFFLPLPHIGVCKTSLGESYFLPNHNLIAIKQLQTAQTAPQAARCIDSECDLCS